MTDIREQLSLVGRRMFERRLADMSGGNISVRDGTQIIISPRFTGTKMHWQLKPSDFIAGELDSNEIQKKSLFSREGKAHLAIYRSFPDVNAIIHSHPFHILPFCATSKPIEPVLEQTQKFGIVRPVKPAPAHSVELAENIVEGFRGMEDNIRKQAAAVLIPKHGIIVAGKTLLGALDALERIDWNAWCILAQRLID